MSSAADKQPAKRQKKKGIAYNSIRCNGKRGKLILNDRRLIFKPKNEEEGTKKLPWEDVAYLQTTPIKAKRHKIKVTDFDHQALIFSVSNREKMLKIFNEAQQRQDTFHQYHEELEEEDLHESRTTKMSYYSLDDIDSHDDTSTWNEASLNWDEGSAFLSSSGHDSSVKGGSLNDSVSASSWNDQDRQVKDSPRRPKKTASLLDQTSSNHESDFSDTEEHTSSPKEIQGVEWEGNRGRFLLQEDGVALLEEGSTRCLFRMSWDELRKQSISSAKSKKFLLRLYVDNETYEVFRLENRESLLLAKQEINRLQAAFLIHKFVDLENESKPEDATTSTHEMSSQTLSQPALSRHQSLSNNEASSSTAFASLDWLLAECAQVDLSAPPGTKRQSKRPSKNKKKRTSKSKRQSAAAAATPPRGDSAPTSPGGEPSGATTSLPKPTALAIRCKSSTLDYGGTNHAVSGWKTSSSGSENCEDDAGVGFVRRKGAGKRSKSVAAKARPADWGAALIATSAAQGKGQSTTTTPKRDVTRRRRRRSVA